MAFKLLLVAAFIAVLNAESTFPPKYTGKPQPNCNVAANFCSGKQHGNYDLTQQVAVQNQNNFPIEWINNGQSRRFNFFVMCSDLAPVCHPCAHADADGIIHNYFSKKCNQCLHKADLEGVAQGAEQCMTTQPTQAHARPTCPATNDASANAQCANKGAKFCGNVVHYQFLNGNPNNGNDPTRIYLGCWMGKYRSCDFCQNGLLFQADVNWDGSPSTFGHCA